MKLKKNKIRKTVLQANKLKKDRLIISKKSNDFSDTIKKIIIRNFLITLIGICIICLFSQTTFSYEKSTYKKMYTSSGDTIWSIAKEEKQNNEYYKNRSIKEIIFDIKEKNQLNSSELKVGQELLIPTY